jgi:hypothetical protein
MARTSNEMLQAWLLHCSIALWCYGDLIWVNNLRDGSPTNGRFPVTNRAIFIVPAGIIMQLCYDLIGEALALRNASCDYRRGPSERCQTNASMKE